MTRRRTLTLAAALLLIATPFLVIRARERQDARAAAPSNGRFVRAGDVDVFIQEEGPATGRPVLLIHGTGAWSVLWRETGDALAAAGFRAIAMDVPPFGYSDKPRGAASYSRQAQARRIIGVLDALGLERAALVGHSVGGRPTVEAALSRPGRVEKLVLVDPALGMGPDGAFEQNRPGPAVRLFFALRPLRDAVLGLTATNPLFTRRMFASFVTLKGSVTPRRVAALQTPLAVTGMNSGQADWLEALMTAPDDSLTSDLSRLQGLTMPTLIVWGRADTVTPLWQGERLQGLIPGSRLKVIDGAGHIPYIEDAAGFHRVLLDFLKAK